MWELLLNAAGKVLGSKTETGQSQLLELFKGSNQKAREFEIELNEQFYKKLELELKDRMNARGMQIAALNQNDTFSKRYLYYLATGICSVTAILAIFPLVLEVPAGNEAMITRATDFFYMLAGGSVIGFFFGSAKDKKTN